MYAIEFQTKIKNNTIEIPKAYQGQLSQHVRVILLGEEAPDDAMDARSIVDVLAASPGQRVFKTAESVNQYLREERDSWDR